MEEQGGEEVRWWMGRSVNIEFKKKKLGRSSRLQIALIVNSL